MHHVIQETPDAIAFTLPIKVGFLVEVSESLGKVQPK
jgi:hypothetical protein